MVSGRAQLHSRPRRDLSGRFDDDLPACVLPELNPIERWWQELKDAFSNPLSGTLKMLRAGLDQQLAAWHQNPVRLYSLASYPYLIDALSSLG